MSETVVHVTTLEQWKSVLDVWFKQGYSWYATGTEYNEWDFLRDGERFLLLNKDNDIVTPSHLDRGIIEYSEFMAQQKEDKEVKTYYVTHEQLDLIEELKIKSEPLRAILTGFSGGWGKLKEIPEYLQKQTLRYLGGDETIEFKVKEQLYRLSRLDKYGDTVYFTKKWGIGNPVVSSKNYAFTAPLDEIKKWQTPAWTVERVD